jgi:hypothetical protein
LLKILAKNVVDFLFVLDDQCWIAKHSIFKVFNQSGSFLAGIKKFWEKN